MKCESKVQKEILQLLDYLGFWHVKTIVVNKAGTPDILGCLDGKFVAIEVKRSDGGRVSDLQVLQMKKIREAGGIAFVATCQADVIAELQKYYPNIAL